MASAPTKMALGYRANVLITAWWTVSLKRGKWFVAEKVLVADKVSLSGNLVAEKLSSGGMVVILIDGFRRMRPFDAVDVVYAVAYGVAKRRRKTWLDKSILGGTP